MADNSTILFTVNFDAKQAEANALNLTKQLTFLRAEKKALEKDFKDNNVGLEEYNKSTIALNGNIALTEKQLASENKAIDANAKANQAARLTVLGLQTGLAALTQTATLQTKAQRDNIVVTQAATKQTTAYTGSITDLDAKISELQKEYNGLSQAKREDVTVGGALLRQINDLTQQQEKNRQVVENSKKTGKEYIKDINVLGINVGSTAESFKAGAQGAATFAKGILSGRGALVALTAVPIVLILTTIVSFLTKSKDGMELLGRKTAAVTAVFDYFSKIVVGIGRAIVSAFEKGELLTKFGDLIKENLTNRVGAFKVILEAIQKLDFRGIASGLIQLFTGVADAPGKINAVTAAAAAAAKQGEALAKQAQLIADAERALNRERSKSRAQIEALKLIGDDVTKGNKERLAATQQAFDKENALLAKQQGLQARKVANIQGEIALRGVSKDALDELSEAESKADDLTAEATTRKIELQNKLNQIRIEGAQASLTKEIAITQAGYEKAKQAGTKNALELGAIQEKLLAQQLALSLVGVVKGSEQESALRTKYATDRAATNIAAVNEEENRLNAIRQSYLATQLADVQKNSTQEFDLRRGALQQQYFQDVAAAKQTILNREQLDAKLKDLDASYLAGKKAINQDEKAVELRNLDDILATRLIKTKAGTQAEADAKKAIIRKQLADALRDENVSIEQFRRLQAQAFSDIGDIQKALREKRISEAFEGLSGISSALSKLTDANITRQTKALDDQQAAAVASAGLSAEARANIEAEFQKKKENLEKEGAEKRRKIATIENVINTAQGITKAYADAGPIFGTILAAIVLANGLAQQAVIASQQFEYGGSPAEGGPVRGPSHKQGGVQLFRKDGAHLGEMEGEEIILTKDVWKNPDLRRKASALNVLGGGRDFAGGAAQYIRQPRMELGGLLAINAQQSGQSLVAPSVQIDYDRLATTLAAMPAPVVLVKDINTGQAKVSRVSSRADS